MGAVSSSATNPNSISSKSRTPKGEPSVIDQLQDEQLDEFKAAFHQFDGNGSGSIDADELQALLASVGQIVSNEEVREMVAAVDTNGTNDLDFNEFVTLMAHKMAVDDSVHGLIDAFSVLDTTGDKVIQSAEMRRIMINVGEPVTLDDVEELIKMVDKDGDGVLDYSEFAHAITYKNKPLAISQPSLNKG